jgi:hypothetical protein
LDAVVKRKIPSPRRKSNPRTPDRPVGQKHNIIKKKQRSFDLLDLSKDVGLEVSREKIKCMFMSSFQNAGKNHDLLIANESFENVSNIRHLGTTAQIEIATTVETANLT